MGILCQNRRTAQGLFPRAFSLDTGRGFDLFDERGDPLAVELLGKPTPAGQRIESEEFDGRILHPVEVLAAAPGGVFLGAIEPDAFKGLAGEQGVDRVGSGPVLRSFEEIFLDAVRQDIDETVDLGLFLVADDDALVASAPELLLPVIETAGLAGQ